MITDNPLNDYDRYEKELSKQDDELPHCDECGSPIYESYFEIDGDCYCEECMNGHKVVVV